MAKVKKLIYLLLFLVVLVGGIVLGLRNKAEVELDLIFNTVGPYPVSALIIGAFFLGIFAGFILSKISQVAHKLASRVEHSHSKDIVTAK
jgi:uncharacterized membrane protein YciS (DUF1049 family)